MNAASKTWAASRKKIRNSKLLSTSANLAIAENKKCKHALELQFLECFSRKTPNLLNMVALCLTQWLSGG